MLRNEDIQAAVAKGWTPNIYLSNLAMAYFDQGQYAARELFPVVPVKLSSSYYYIWKKGDLARRQMRPKPQFGRVAPAQFGWKDQSYHCKPVQIIVGQDLLENQNFTASGAPIDPRVMRARFVAEQINLEMDANFAEKYFKASVWEQKLVGKASNPGTGEFLQFDNENSDPLATIEIGIKTITKSARRRPNKLGIGYETWEKIKHHPDVLARVLPGGSTLNPAKVTTNALAALLEIEKVVVFSATYNKAQEGLTDDMDFICDPYGMLLVYAPNQPMIEEPSAGYQFAWDFTGNGTWIALDEWEGDRGTHTDFREGLISYDAQITAQDCAFYFDQCVAPSEA